MNYFEKAVELDMNKKYVAAMEMYEDSIIANEGILDAYINLAYIYWAAGCELAWSVNININKIIRRNGYELSFIKLTEAKKFFDSSELYFWELYFKRRTIGDDISESEIVNILNRHPFTGYDPYFYLFLLDREKYIKEAKTLYQECMNNPIFKNIEMMSVMSALLDIPQGIKKYR